MPTSPSATVPTDPTGGPPGVGASKKDAAASAVQEHAGAAMGAARDEAGHVVRSARDHALNVMDSAGHELRERGQEQTERLSGRLGEASGELRRMAGATEDSSALGGVVRSLADSAERAARRLDEGGPEGVLDDLRVMARRHPARFLAMAAAGGFLAARLVRSTDTQSVTQAVQQAAGDDDTASRAAPASRGGVPQGAQEPELVSGQGSSTMSTPVQGV